MQLKKAAQEKSAGNKLPRKTHNFLNDVPSTPTNNCTKIKNLKKKRNS